MSTTKNSIHVIYPYLHQFQWVFDDERADLVREPFVAGTDHLIDEILSRKCIDGSDGFTLVFSANFFPGYDACLHWVRAEEDGNWYRWEEAGREGWLCGALSHYFDEAPPKIYVQVNAGAPLQTKKEKP